MRAKTMKIFTALSVVSLLFASNCAQRGSKTTGWNYNDPNMGGFEYTDYIEQETGPGLILVEGGVMSIGRVEEDVMYDWNNSPRSVTVSSFYMDVTEVRNVDYREYLYWLKRVYRGYPQVREDALPDTLVWRRKLAYNEPYVEYYFRHPSYQEYPVVGVSWVQASKYCLWRTDRVNESILLREGLLEMNTTNDQTDGESFNTDAYLAGQYTRGVIKVKDLGPIADERNIRMEDGVLLPKYRLPTEAEWEFAAYALIGNTYDERIFDRRVYPWNGHYVRNDGSHAGYRHRGKMMANFVRARGDYMGTAGALNDNADVTAPVESYWPNDYGLYNMAGNVSEWVLDVYRPSTFQDFDEFRPYRGNVFKTWKKDAQGNIAPKNELGQLEKREVRPEETIGRENYRKADNINYLDGDLQSSILFEEGDWKEGYDIENSQRMYNNNTGDPFNDDDSAGMYVDPVVKEVQGKDVKVQGEKMTSLISNKTRVYKGGSWRDRAYWLSPGTRRFLDENKSRDDLGFRCAMTRIGSPSGMQ
jgi:gliding motility-associated lipoprotein GldJ